MKSDSTKNSFLETQSVTLPALLVEYISQNNPFTKVNTRQLEFMKKNYSEFSHESQSVISQLNVMAIDKPQFFLNSGRILLDKPDWLWTILSKTKGKFGNNKLSTIDKIELIAAMFETTNMLRLGAYLLSDKKVAIDDLKKKLQILKHFDKLGLDSVSRSLINKVRNCSNHLINLDGDSLVLQDKTRMSIHDLDELYNKFEKVFSWWLTIVFSSLIYQPICGLLLISGYLDYLKNERNLIFNKSMALFFPNIDQQVQEYQEMKKKDRKAITEPTNIALNFVVLEGKAIDEFLTNCGRYGRRLSFLIDRLCEKITNQDDLERMRKLNSYAKNTDQFLKYVINERNIDKVRST